MIILATIIAFFVGCNRRQPVQKESEQSVTTETEKQPAGNAIYYWRTTFSLNSDEKAFLRRHNINRLYLRMFDVAVEEDYAKTCKEIVPIATTRFNDSIPSNIEIVPVVYITIDALRELANRNKQYFAQLIVDRMLAMCSYNECGTISELQLDCDWTSTTKSSYILLCEEAKKLLAEKNIKLSITIRLHQLEETPPPADRGVLMLYNTGALKNYNAKNSILHYDDVRPYMTSVIRYPIPLDYAYPTFGWGVKFRNKKFVSIVSNPDAEKVGNGETIRRERPSVKDILTIKELTANCLGKADRRNILYHLDSEQLKNYSEDEINKIFAR